MIDMTARMQYFETVIAASTTFGNKVTAGSGGATAGHIFWHQIIGNQDINPYAIIGIPIPDGELISQSCHFIDHKIPLLFGTLEDLTTDAKSSVQSFSDFVSGLYNDLLAANVGPQAKYKFNKISVPKFTIPDISKRNEDTIQPTDYWEVCFLLHFESGR